MKGINGSTVNAFFYALNVLAVTVNGFGLTSPSICSIFAVTEFEGMKGFVHVFLAPNTKNEFKSLANTYRNPANEFKSLNKSSCRIIMFDTSRINRPQPKVIEYRHSAKKAEPETLNRVGDHKKLHSMKTLI